MSKKLKNLQVRLAQYIIAGYLTDMNVELNQAMFAYIEAEKSLQRCREVESRQRKKTQADTETGVITYKPLGSKILENTRQATDKRDSALSKVVYMLRGVPQSELSNRCKTTVDKYVKKALKHTLRTLSSTPIRITIPTDMYDYLMSRGVNVGELCRKAMLDTYISDSSIHPAYRALSEREGKIWRPTGGPIEID